MSREMILRKEQYFVHTVLRNASVCRLCLFVRSVAVLGMDPDGFHNARMDALFDFSV
jgi:hypothetical protein